MPILGAQKVRAVAAAFGIKTERRQLKNIAADLADALLDDLSRSDPHEPYRTIGAMAPPERQRVWDELDIITVSAYHKAFNALHRSGCATDGDWLGGVEKVVALVAVVEATVVRDDLETTLKQSAV